MKSPGLEELRQIFKDDRLHLAIGNVVRLELAQDRSVLRVIVNIFPELIEMVCKMTWDNVGPESGIFQFPSVNDMVLVGFVDGSEDEAFVLRRLTSQEDKIPIAAEQGHLVLRSLSGTKAFLNSDTEINLVRKDTPGDERLVLGDTFKAAYSSHLDIDSSHTHIGNLGFATLVPDQAADYSAIKSSPVDDDAILSDLTKTEK